MVERDNKINKSLDELVNEDKKLSKMHSSRRRDDDRGGRTEGGRGDSRRGTRTGGAPRDRSNSPYERRGTYMISIIK